MSTPQNKDILLKSLFDRYFPHLVIYAMQIVEKRDIAEDIVQEVFFKLWKKDQLQMRSVNFLYSCVKNASVNYHHSKEGKVQKVSEDFIKEALLDDTSFEKEEEKMKLLEDLYEAIEGLPLQCREVLKQVYLMQQTYSDVAHQMGISVNTVKSHMTKAFRLLRKHFSASSILYFSAFFKLLQ